MVQSEILNHFRESTAGDVQMESLRAEFEAAVEHFKKEGHAWLKPQDLTTRLSTVRQMNTRNEFERRFFYHNPQKVRKKTLKFSINFKN